MESSHTSRCPKASLIIPTRNRAGRLPRTLAALVRQTAASGGPGQDFEVLLVADGCTDDTARVAEEFSGRLQLALIEQAAQGAGAARNRGARAARGDLLIFMDDDVEAQAEFIDAHLRAHAAAGRRVVIGYLPPRLGKQTGYLRTELAGWWEDTFQALREPGRRYRFSDLTSGNFSLPAALFHEVGGFDEGLRCREDYELGARLQQAQAEFVYSEQAAGFHHEWSANDQVFARKFEEGKADVYMGRKHPELRPALLMARLNPHTRLLKRLLKQLAFRAPASGDRVAKLLRRLLSFFDRARALRSWQRLLYTLLEYWYWRGAALELGSFQALNSFLHPGRTASPAVPPPLEIDLLQGLEAAERQLEALRPAQARLYFGETFTVHIPPEPGGERLCARHLRPLLATRYRMEMLAALASTPDLIDPDMRAQLGRRLSQWVR